jgi:hypothetical protein
MIYEVTMSGNCNDLSLAQKNDVHNKIKLQPPGSSSHRLSEILGILKSTTAQIKIQELFLREQASQQVTI